MSETPEFSRFGAPPPPSGYAKHLSKRELFAAMAMQGMFTDARLHENMEIRALAAVQAADALLAALSPEAPR